MEPAEEVPRITNLVLQYPSFKLFGFLYFSSNLKGEPFVFSGLIGEVSKRL